VVRGLGRERKPVGRGPPWRWDCATWWPRCALPTLRISGRWWPRCALPTLRRRRAGGCGGGRCGDGGTTVRVDGGSLPTGPAGSKTVSASNPAGIFYSRFGPAGPGCASPTPSDDVTPFRSSMSRVIGFQGLRLRSAAIPAPAAEAGREVRFGIVQIWRAAAGRARVVELACNMIPHLTLGTRSLGTQDLDAPSEGSVECSRWPGWHGPDHDSTFRVSPIAASLYGEHVS
jgi:hypothetical protein